MPSFGVSVRESTEQEVNDLLSYGDSRSKWIENAMRMKLDVTRVLDGDLDPEEVRGDDLREFVSVVRSE